MDVPAVPLPGSLLWVASLAFVLEDWMDVGGY